IFPRAPASALRARKFVAANPPSGSATTEFNPIGSGATAHPIQVKDGGFARASSSKTSIDSLLPWWTAYNVCIEFLPARSARPCVRNFAFSAASGGPGQELYVFESSRSLDVAAGYATAVVLSRTLIRRIPPVWE